MLNVLIRFNLCCEVVFSLTKKKNNTFQLRRHIESTITTRGQSALYDAIEKSMNQFNLEEISENRWIVAITDGEDNASLKKLRSIKEELNKFNINLIIVGMALPKAFASILSDLCKATKDGVFIETPNNDDLDVAFEAISNIVYGQNFIVESF